MTKKELQSMLGENDAIDFHGLCHDCKKPIVVTAGIKDDEVIVIGGAVYKVPPPSISEDNIFIKCPECFEKNKELCNWRKLEVFSRVCGYLRPIDQWNRGKQAEHMLRKNYDFQKGVEHAECFKND